MSELDPETPDAPYEVGYGKPPLHSRFRAGTSGNPGGRAGPTAERAKALVLEEAYRLVTVREGDKVLKIPAIQAILRSQFALAAKGNGPAQRAFIATIQAIEQAIAAEAEKESLPLRIERVIVDPGCRCRLEPGQAAPESAQD